MESFDLRENQTILKNQGLLKGLISTLFITAFFYLSSSLISYWINPSYQQLLKELVNAGLHIAPVSASRNLLNKCIEVSAQTIQLGGYVYLYYQTQPLWIKNSIHKKILLSIAFLILINMSELVMNPLLDLLTNTKLGYKYAVSFVGLKYLNMWLNTLLIGVALVIFTPQHIPLEKYTKSL